MRPFDKRQLATLVDMESPEAVHEEVLHILSLILPDFDTEPLHRVFRFTVDLYVHQGGCGWKIVIPQAVMDSLKVPDQLAGFGIETK